MAVLNCKLNRNISINQNSSEAGCGSTEIAIQGLRSPLYVYNISDVSYLKYKDDMRADATNVVDTIVANGKPYTVDFSSGSYSETYNNGTWTHNLTLEIDNIAAEYEDILKGAVNGKYLVCFRPKGENDFRMFGWKNGASIRYTLNMGDSNLGYSLTFESSNEFSLFTVYAENFKLNTLSFDPTFMPLYEVSANEADGNGNLNGYSVALYSVKVNGNGDALDEDNVLCEYSGKKQIAYKLDGFNFNDSTYEVIGTYTKDAVFDGRAVRIFDAELLKGGTDSIHINGEKEITINLNSKDNTGSFDITSNNDWELVEYNPLVNIVPREGKEGISKINLTYCGIGGSHTCKFINKVTDDTVSLTTNVNLIKVYEKYAFNNGTKYATISVVAEGGEADYDYEVTPKIDIKKDEHNLLILQLPESDDEQNFVITLTHKSDRNEVKNVNVRVAKKDEIILSMFE